MKAVTLWSEECFSGLGMSPIAHIDGHITGIMPRVILENHLVPWDRRTYDRAFILQQYSGIKHASKVVNNFIFVKKARVLSWPSPSKHLTPIELMWQVLKNRLERISLINYGQ